MWKQSCAVLTLAGVLATSQATASELKGIWAMLPLKSGVANVIEFTENQATAHGFDCYGKGESEQSADPETLKYQHADSNITLSKDGKTVSVLQIKAISAEELTLLPVTEGLANDGISFIYRKVSSVKPLCELYQEPT